MVGGIVRPSVWESSSERSRLHLLLSFSLQEGQGQNGLMESCGERAQPLQSVKSKYLAVSPVTDNFEYRSKDVNKRSHHSNFSKLKFCWVNKGS